MITVVKQPFDITPGFNPVEFHIKSDEQDRSDFRFVVKIYDGTMNLLSVKRVVGNSDLDYVTIVDIHKQLASLQYLESWKLESGGVYYTDFDFKAKYNVTIAEYYDGEEAADPVEIENLYTFPASLPAIKFPSYDYEDFKTNVRWLTNFKTISVRPTDKVTVTFFTGTGIDEFNVKAYKGSLVIDEFNADMSSSPLPAESFFHLHGGYELLATVCGFDSNTINLATHYVVYFNGEEPDGMTFKLINCSRFPGVRLHYLNEWGGVDSFLFGLVTRRGTSIEKKKAKLPFSGSTLRPSIYGVGTSPYLVTFTDSLKLTSDFITEDDSNALLELFTSPIVCAEVEQKLFLPSSVDGTKIIIPAEIDVNNYEFKQSRIDKLFNLELEAKISVSNARQSL